MDWMDKIGCAIVFLPLILTLLLICAVDLAIERIRGLFK
jgi:hypothetical protein